METPLATVETRACPRCGAIVTVDAPQCTVCDRESSEIALEAQVLSSPADSATFSLSTLFLLTALCAVWATVCAMSPLMGVAFAVLALPAVLRTGRVSNLWWYCQRQPIPASTLISEFWGSFLIVMAIVVISVLTVIGSLMMTGIVAVLLTEMCRVTFQTPPDVLGTTAWALMLAALVFSVAVGAYTAHVLLRATWPHRSREWPRWKR